MLNILHFYCCQQLDLPSIIYMLFVAISSLEENFLSSDSLATV